jgi:hypothetical protein
MKLHASLTRLTFAALIVSAGTLALAPTAHADHGWRRYKQVRRGPWDAPVSRVVYRDRVHDGAGPVFAGLIGGMILGAALSHPHPVVVRERVYDSGYDRGHGRGCERGYDRVVAPPAPLYRYEDVDSDRYWDSLDECRQPQYGYECPRVVRVVEISSGRCARTMYWKHDHWISDDDRENSDD